MGSSPSKKDKEEDKRKDQNKKPVAYSSSPMEREQENTKESEKSVNEGTEQDSQTELCDNNEPEAPHLSRDDIEKIWKEVDSTPDSRPQPEPDRERTGWGTVKIFVSSTFKDFRQEREVLIKKIMRELSIKCEERKLNLIPIDLRWGIPKDHSEVESAEICLEQIQSCIKQNGMPFFIGMIGDRSGTIIDVSEKPILKQVYGWVDNLSVTEMEIVRGAYRMNNPNALFLLRTPSIPEKEAETEVQEEYLQNYLPRDDTAKLKVEILKQNLQTRFGIQTVNYPVEYDFEPEDLKIQGLDDTFTTKTLHFMKERIYKQYPPLKEHSLDPHLVAKNRHRGFMENRGELFGRDDVIKKIRDYISSDLSCGPLLVVGGAGVGKSAIMAEAAMSCQDQEITDRHVFYHFVGAVPGSTELLPMLQRLLKELKDTEDYSVPKSLSEAAQETCEYLSNQKAKKTIIIVDALNQFDDDEEARLMRWVPKQIAPNIRCVFSLIQEDGHSSPQFDSLQDGTSPEQILRVQPIQTEDRKKMINTFFSLYGKELEDEDLNFFVSKQFAGNPLWLSLAREELRVFDKFLEIRQKIESLEDDLLGLEIQVLERLVSESDEGKLGNLLEASLCLLEASDRGLLEQELLQLQSQDEPDNERDGYTAVPTVTLVFGKLFAALKPFVRPFGDSREGRLDFYHRSISKAVRKKFYEKNSGKWHRLLADYFKNNRNVERRLEEYPKQLIACNDTKQLEIFLTDWEVFDKFYDETFSSKLISYWKKGSSLEMMSSCYKQALKQLQEEDQDPVNIFNYHIKVAQLCIQGEQFDVVNSLCDDALRLGGEQIEPEIKAQIHYLKGLVVDEKIKLANREKKSHMPDIAMILMHYRSAKDIYEKQDDQKNQARLASVLERMAFYYCGYARRGGDEFLSKEEASRTAFECIDQAISILHKLGKILDEADALITKGLCHVNTSEERIQTFLDAEKMVLPLTGRYNMILYRCYYNMAIYYDKLEQWDIAYDYFHKAYNISYCLFGATHGKTERLANILRETEYISIAAERGKTVP